MPHTREVAATQQQPLRPRENCEYANPWCLPAHNRSTRDLARTFPGCFFLKYWVAAWFLAVTFFELSALSFVLCSFAEKVRLCQQFKSKIHRSQISQIRKYKAQSTKYKAQNTKAKKDYFRNSCLNLNRCTFPVAVYGS